MASFSRTMFIGSFLLLIYVPTSNIPSRPSPYDLYTWKKKNLKILGTIYMHKISDRSGHENTKVWTYTLLRAQRTHKKIWRHWSLDREVFCQGILLISLFRLARSQQAFFWSATSTWTYYWRATLEINKNYSRCFFQILTHRRLIQGHSFLGNLLFFLENSNKMELRNAEFVNLKHFSEKSRL